MPSPFPGMDPYLEDRKVWPEFHAIAIVKMRKAIDDALPPGYSAHIGRHVYVVEPGDDRLLIGLPDTSVSRGDRPDSGKTVATLEAPLTVSLPAVRRESNRYVEVLDDDRHEVVTVVE